MSQIIESASSGDSVMHSPRLKPKRQPIHKVQGRMKMLEYGTKIDFLNQSNSETVRSADKPHGKRSESAKRVIYEDSGGSA